MGSGTDAGMAGKRGVLGAPARASARAGRKNGIPLGSVVKLLPTPTARLGRTGGNAERADRALRTGTGPDLADAVAQLLPTPRASDGKNGGPNQRGSKGDLALPSAVLSERWAEYAPAIARHVATTGIEPPEPTEPNRNGEPRLAPAFAEWLMDLPSGWVTDIAERVPALKGIGNGVVPRQARAAWLMLQDIETLLTFC
jgi:DNA (cytosine-5)-methyltransferase 1